MNTSMIFRLISCDKDKLHKFNIPPIYGNFLKEFTSNFFNGDNTGSHTSLYIYWRLQRPNMISTFRSVNGLKVFSCKICFKCNHKMFIQKLTLNQLHMLIFILLVDLSNLLYEHHRRMRFEQSLIIFQILLYLDITFILSFR